MRRVPSVWGTALGPQFQNSLLQGLANGAPAQMTTPQSIDLNNFLQQSGGKGAAPLSLLNY